MKFIESFSRQQELRKVYETPHEKRQRRLVKKMEKEKRKKSALGWDAEHMGMTNANNPFGDEKLLDTFVWKKKLEKKGLSNVPAEHLKVITAQRVEENKVKNLVICEKRFALVNFRLNWKN